LCGNWNYRIIFNAITKMKTSTYFLILSIPIVLFILKNKRITGKYSRNFQKKFIFRSIQSVGHNFLGIATAIVAAKQIDLKISNKIRKIALFVLMLSYPAYNLNKRLYKSKKKFYDSSYFSNLADYVLGYAVTYAVLFAADKTQEMELDEFDVPIKYYIIVSSLTITLLLFLLPLLDNSVKPPVKFSRNQIKKRLNVL